MRFISITKSINIRLDWANITGTVLKAGTPISLTGVVANTADAVGILSQDVSKSDAVVAVVTEGTIDLGEIAASYGELDDAAISAMHGITFIDDGEPVAPSGGNGLPDYSEASDGDVLSIEDGAPAWKEPSGGGGGVFLVTITASGSAPNFSYSADKTFAEIVEAASGGTPILVALINSSETAFSAIVSVKSEAVAFVFPAAMSVGTQHFIAMSVMSLDATDAITAANYVVSAQKTA